MISQESGDMGGIEIWGQGKLAMARPKMQVALISICGQAAINEVIDTKVAQAALRLAQTPF